MSDLSISPYNDDIHRWLHLHYFCPVFFLAAEICTLQSITGDILNKYDNLYWLNKFVNLIQSCIAFRLKIITLHMRLFKIWRPLMSVFVCVTWIIMSVSIPYTWSSATNICCTFILQKLLFKNIYTKFYLCKDIIANIETYLK